MGKSKACSGVRLILALLLGLALGSLEACSGQSNPPPPTTSEQQAALLTNRILEFLTFSVSRELSLNQSSNVENRLAFPLNSKDLFETASRLCVNTFHPAACSRGGSVSIQSASCQFDADSSLLNVCGSVDFSECLDFSAAGCSVLSNSVDFCLSISSSNVTTLSLQSPQNPLLARSCENSYNFDVELQASCDFPIKPFTSNPASQQCADHHFTFQDENGCLQCRAGTCSLDQECDGVPDAVDNCPEDFNPRQTDSDQDGIGDVCEAFLPGGVDCGSRSCETSFQCEQIARFCPGAVTELGVTPVCCDGTCHGPESESLCIIIPAPVNSPPPLPDCFCVCPPDQPACVLCGPDDPPCGPLPPPPLPPPPPPPGP